MSTITQTIGSYSGGISQQPDELKLPGQVTDALNILPDVTEGLMKRPGGKLVKSLSDGSLNSYTTGKWFHYYRDENEQYVGQVIRRSGHADDGKIRMWRCSDGYEMTVTYTSSQSTALFNYLKHTNDADIQTLTLNDYTYLTNRTKTTAMSSATTDPKPHQAFIELRKIAYASNYGINIYDTTGTESFYQATEISVERQIDSNNMCDSNGALPSGYPGHGNKCDDSAGQNNDALCPCVKTQIATINHGSRPDSSTVHDANGENWSISVNSNGGSAGDRKNLAIRFTTTGQPVSEGGSGDPAYWCRYTTTHDLLYGGEGWRTGDWFEFWMARAKYKITVTKHTESIVQANLGLIRPNPTPFDNETTVTADSILGDLRSRIMADTFGTTTGAAVEQVGNGLYIKRTSGTFNINTPANDLMNVFTDKVNDVADLPSQCKHGYVVKVANGEAAEDDYYVKFFGNNDRDGEGVWEECPEPGRKHQFAAETMPIQMARTSATEFTVSQIAWENCPVGDSTTAPEPSFIGQTINKMLFFRNRFVLLSDENVIMSKPGDFFNFWPKSAIIFTDDDAIDISCSSEYPAIVYDGIQVNAGLLLFTKNQQFMLTTDSDILSPQTAKINALSTYNFNFNTNPISLGTTVGFLDNAGKNTRFFEMAGVVREGQPDVLEQTKIVSRLFPKGITTIANSRENSTIFFSEKGKAEIFGYRYFSSIEKRLQNAWFRWKVSGEVQHLAMLDDALYAVIRNNSKDVLQKFSIKLDDSSNYITDDLGTTDADDDIDYRIHLDNATLVPHTDLTYNISGNYTQFNLPAGFNNTDAQLAVIYNPTGSDKTFMGMVEKAYTVSNGTKVRLTGNWEYYDPQGLQDANIGVGSAPLDDVKPAGNLILGYLYDMEVKFPTVYYQRQVGENFRSEVQGSLVVHRLKFSFGPLGVYETVLDRVGKPTYKQLYESLLADKYISNRVQFTQDTKATLPIYEKNTNVKITLKSTHPSPATLYSMTWEGEYTPKFYQRV